MKMNVYFLSNLTMNAFVLYFSTKNEWGGTRKKKYFL